MNDVSVTVKYTHTDTVVTGLDCLLHHFVHGDYDDNSRYFTVFVLLLSGQEPADAVPKVISEGRKLRIILHLPRQWTNAYLLNEQFKNVNGMNCTHQVTFAMFLWAGSSRPSPETLPTG